MMLFLMKFQTDENSSVAPVEQKKSRREQFLDKQDGVFLYIVAGISGQIRDDMKKKGTPVTSFLDYGNAEDSEEIKDKKFNDIRRLFTGFLNGGDIITNQFSTAPKNKNAAANLSYYEQLFDAVATEFKKYGIKAKAGLAEPEEGDDPTKTRWQLTSTQTADEMEATLEKYYTRLGQAPLNNDFTPTPKEEERTNNQTTAQNQITTNTNLENITPKRGSYGPPKPSDEFLKQNEDNTRQKVKEELLENSKKEITKALAPGYYEGLRDYLNNLANFSNLDSLDVLQNSAAGIERNYTALAEYPEYAKKISDLLISVHKKLMPSLQGAIKITYDPKTGEERAELAQYVAKTDPLMAGPQMSNTLQLTKSVNDFARAVVMFNTFDKAASDLILRGIPVQDRKGFETLYSAMSSKDKKTGTDYKPYMDDVLSMRYGVDGAGLQKVRELLGYKTVSTKSAATQYFDMMDDIVINTTPEGEKKMANAYNAWRRLQIKYGQTASADDPLTVLTGAGAVGQKNYYYNAYPNNVQSSGVRSTFDFAAQLMAADTFGSDKMKKLSSADLYLAVSSAATLPAGIQAAYFSHPTFFQRISDFAFLQPVDRPTPILQTPNPAEEAMKSDFYSECQKYIAVLYSMQADRLKRYDIVSDIMGKFEDALYRAGRRIDEIQGDVADQSKLARGSIDIPLLSIGLQIPYFVPTSNASQMTRLRYNSIFEGLIIPEVMQGGVTTQSNMFGNFRANEYQADQYLRNMFYANTTEVYSTENYLHFRPSYESIMGELTYEFNQMKKNLVDLDWNAISGSGSLQTGEGVQSAGVGVDALAFWQGFNRGQTALLEGFAVPKEGVTNVMARGQLTQTQVLDVQVWDLLGRMDEYIQNGTFAPGVGITQVTDKYEVLRLDSTYGKSDGSCTANFWKVAHTGSYTETETYAGEALIRQGGQWFKVIIDHDSINNGKVRDALDHYFAHVNLEANEYVLRGAAEYETMNYPSKDYDKYGLGVMLVGQIPPIANLVVGGAGSKKKEYSTVASVDIGKKTYITTMAYRYNRQDLLNGMSNINGINTVNSSGTDNYRVYETLPGDATSVAYVGALQVHADELFRATIFGGYTDYAAKGIAKNAVLGGAVTTKYTHTEGGVTYDERSGFNRARFSSLGKLPDWTGISYTDYVISGDIGTGQNQSQNGILYGAVTKRFMDDKKSPISSITIFGTSQEVGNKMMAASAQSLAIRAKDIIASLPSGEMNRDQEVSLLMDMRSLGNDAIRNAIEDFWGQPAYQFGIGYTTYRGKKNRTLMEDIDGFLLIGGVRNPVTGEMENNYTAAINLMNKVAFVGMYQPSDGAASIGTKISGVGKGVAGFYISSVPTLSGGKQNMFTADTEQVGIFGEKSKTSAAISIGEKNSYKGQLFHSIEGKESVTYFQMNVFNYGLDKDSFSGQEIGFGYRSGGFFAAMAGLSQFQTELYAGLGQLQLGKAAGYYIDFGATLIGNQSKLMLTGSAELNKNAHWSLGLKYSYSFGP